MDTNIDSVKRFLDLHFRTCVELRWLGAAITGDKLRFGIEQLTRLEQARTVEEASLHADALLSPHFHQHLQNKWEAVVAASNNREELFVVFKMYVGAYKVTLASLLSVHERLLQERARDLEVYAEMQMRISLNALSTAV